MAIVADAELHNRAELIARLSSVDASSESPDASLILAAYEKWGEGCPEYLLGEFSFAIWDARLGTLFCCRDHVGSRPFLYWTSGTRFVFSSDSQSLFKVPGIARELNRSKLLEFTAVPGYLQSGDRETLFNGIFSIPAGTCLIVTGNERKRRTYWAPAVIPNLVPQAEQEAIEAFRELLFQAVECRLQGKRQVAAHFSGGLDSSAVVGVAARCMEKSNRNVLAIAAVLPDSSKPEFADEREFIEEFGFYPNVTLQYAAPEDGGPFDLIQEPSSFFDTPVIGSRRYLLRAMDSIAAAQGAEVSLSGAMGETGATAWGHGYCLELAAGFRWSSLVRELRGLSKTRRVSPVTILGREFLDFLSPNRRFQPPILLAPDFLRNAEYTSADWGEGVRELSWPPDHRRTQLNMIRHRMRALAYGRPWSQPLSVPVVEPLLDKRILEFCLSMPGDLKLRNGYPRYLIRKALEGILPRKIQWRTDKHPFAPDYKNRYRKQLSIAKAFVSAIRRKDPVRSIVDVERLRYLLDHPDTPAGQWAAIGAVPRSIYLICFLRQFAEFRP